MLTQPGDTVLLEDPIYPGLRNVFARSGVRAVGVPVEAGGIDVETLARRIERERPRLLVVTPNFQNPTGATMPLGARQTLLRVARDAGLVVVENDIYGELRYEGEALPSLKQLDAAGDVIQLQELLQDRLPGLARGLGDGPAGRSLRGWREAKQVSDLHTDQLSQAVLLRFRRVGPPGGAPAADDRGRRGAAAAVMSACERHLPAGHALHPAAGRHESVGAAAGAAGRRRVAGAGRSARA